MRDIHLNRELLRAIAKGEVEPRILVKIGLEHLRCLCPTCAAEWDAWESEKESASSDRLQTRLPGFLASQLKLIASAEERAAEDFRQLMAIEPTRRVTRVVRSRNRYRSAALVRLLIAEARRAVNADHQSGYHFADLAFHVADRLTGLDVTQGLVPLSLAEMANALRFKPDSRGARALFDRSRALTQLANVSDPSVIARIDHLEAAYYLSLRRFSESEQLLERSKILYGLVGASADIAKVDLTLSLLFLEMGKPFRALQALREVLRSTAAQEDQRLYFWARINMARALFETKDLRQAKRILDQDESRHAQKGEPLAHLRYGWIRGRIAASERDLEAAKEHFAAVRNGFISAGVGYDAALVSLDLALACLRLGRPDVVRQLTEEMLPIFASQDIHREALAALRLFQEAVQQEVVTEALVRDLRDYLQEARCQPEVRFQPGAGAEN
jgi:tetratricopeptide (TPR) repeat protein